MTKFEVFPFIQSTVKYAVVTNPQTPATMVEQFSTGGYSFRLEGDLQSLPSEEIDDLNEQLVKLASDELDRRRP
jgi:hypothetical protein